MTEDKVNTEEECITESLKEEHKRFGEMKPLPTFLILSVGPLLMQVGTALHDSVDLLLISKAYGSYGIIVAGLPALIRFVCDGIGLYFGFAATIKLPMLIGQNRQTDAHHFIVDLFRVSLGLSILITIVIYFISEPMLNYMQCPADVLPVAMKYVTPIVVTTPFLVMLQVSLGIIQGEGRSILCGILQFSVFLLNCGVCSPIVLFGIKAPVEFAGIPYTVAHVIPAIVLFVLIHAKIFNMKPDWSMWKQPIQGEVWIGLKLASSFLVFLVTMTFPPMFLVHYLLMAAGSIGQVVEVNAAFNVIMKTIPFVGSWTEGFTQGFMSAGAFATGTKDIRRFIKLAIWALVFCLGTYVVFMPITIIDPWLTAKMWLSSDQEKYWAREFNMIPFYTMFLQCANEVTNCMCMSFGNGWAPLIPGVLKGVSEIVGVLCLYHTGDGKTNPTRIVYVYQVMDLVVFIVDLIYLFTIIIPYVKKQLAQNEPEKENNNTPEVL